MFWEKGKKPERKKIWENGKIISSFDGPFLLRGFILKIMAGFIFIGFFQVFFFPAHQWNLQFKPHGLGRSLTTHGLDCWLG